MEPIEMTTLSRVLESLRLKGIVNEIKMNDTGQMVAEQTGKIYQPQDLVIFRTFRFEGDSDPGNNAVLYITEDLQGDIGYILDSYGMYSNNEGTAFDDFLKKIKMENRQDQKLFE